MVLEISQDVVLPIDLTELEIAGGESVNEVQEWCISIRVRRLLNLNAAHLME